MKCPLCSYRFDAHSCLNGVSQPNVGDLTLCAGCLGTLQFELAAGGGLGIRALSAAEISALPFSARMAVELGRSMLRDLRGGEAPAAPPAEISDRIREAKAYELARNAIARARREG